MFVSVKISGNRNPSWYKMDGREEFRTGDFIYIENSINRPMKVKVLEIVKKLPSTVSPTDIGMIRYSMNLKDKINQYGIYRLEFAVKVKYHRVHNKKSTQGTVYLSGEGIKIEGDFNLSIRTVLENLREMIIKEHFKDYVVIDSMVHHNINGDPVKLTMTCKKQTFESLFD